MMHALTHTHTYPRGTEENFPNLIKNIYKNPTTPLLLDSERLNAFSLGLGTIKDVSSQHYLTVLEILAGAIRQENEIKDKQIKGKN